MLQPKNYPLFTIFVGMLLALALAFIAPGQTRASSPVQVNDGSKCVTCHEELYYSHDTGKAFCLSDSPMSCVDCHGGDPTAVTKETAHFDRNAHPIINDDDKKCYECHPAQAAERVQTFEKVAGVNQVLVAQPCIIEPQEVLTPAKTPASMPLLANLGIPETLFMVLSGSVLLVAIGFVLFKTR